MPWWLQIGKVTPLLPVSIVRDVSHVCTVHTLQLYFNLIYRWWPQVNDIFVIIRWKLKLINFAGLYFKAYLGNTNTQVYKRRIYWEWNEINIFWNYDIFFYHFITQCLMSKQWFLQFLKWDTKVCIFNRT